MLVVESHATIKCLGIAILLEAVGNFCHKNKFNCWKPIHSNHDNNQMIDHEFKIKQTRLIVGVIPSEFNF